jgi:hypothetical protein
MTSLIFASAYLSKSVAYNGFGVTLGFKILLSFCSIIIIGGILGSFYMYAINIVV